MLLSSTKGDNESYIEKYYLVLKNKPDLRIIVNWSVTSKPYSIYNENEKNLLQL